MVPYPRSIFIATAIVAAAAVSGCATKIKASASTNPPPAEAFSQYGRIEVRPAMFMDGVTGNAAALAKINENIQHDLKAPLAQWNSQPENGRRLVVQPVVEQLSFKHGAGRVLLGPLVGSSGVLMRLQIRDASGKTVASPEFFQRANAMAAGWTFGVHDNLMLTRVANLASGYLKANYTQAVGGTTGGDDPVVAPAK
ncbi:MAG TPA: hypothetical protein VIT92_05315 [Burkholderiaceae bacterium]